VAALDDDGAVVGFLAATLTGEPGDRAVRIRVQQHAACADGGRMTYRRMYQALAQRLVAIGCFEHSVVVAAEHRDTVQSLVELGFGMDQIKGLRSLTPPASGTEAALRPAGADDLPRVVDLVWELQRFHADAPMLSPAVIDLLALRDDMSAAIADENRLVLLAESDDGPAGLMVVDPDHRTPGAATIGIAVVTTALRGRALGTSLLSGAVAWAAERGFDVLTAGWTSANLVSDAFWRGHGFAPVRYTLTRRIDPRVAWADSRLSRGDLFPGL